MNNQNPTGIEITDIRLKKSPIPMFVSIIGITVVLQIMSLLIGLGFEYFFEIEQSILFTSIKYAVLIIIEIIIILYFILDWKNDYYKITSESVTHKHGIFTNRGTTLIFRNIIEIQMNRSFWGRMFNYGTIEMQAQLMKRPILIENISDPNTNFKLIQRLSTESKADIPISTTPSEP